MTTNVVVKPLGHTLNRNDDRNIRSVSGLAFLLGQFKNPIGAMQTYEFDPADQGGRYQAAALLE